MIVISFFASGLLTVAIAVAALIAGKLLVRWRERLDTTRERPFRDTVRSVQAMIVGVVLFFWLFYFLFTRIRRLLEHVFGT